VLDASVCPTCGVPVITGAEAMAGGRGRTAAVGAEVACATAGELGGIVVSVAVSVTSMVSPMSAVVSRKLDPVGPLAQAGLHTH